MVFSSIKKKDVVAGVFFLSFGCFLAGVFLACATTNEDTKSSESKEEASAAAELAEKEQKQLDDYRAELEIGRNMAGRLLQFYGTQKDEGLLDYVNLVGAYVGKNSDYPERKYQFQILNDNTVNAFACPGGYILVTMGAVRHANTEAELAGVLAHEIAHVGKKHMFDKLKSMSKEDLEKAAEAAQKKAPEPDSVMARRRPKNETNKIAEAAAKFLSGGATGLSILKAAGAGMSVILEQGLGAEKEYEADAHGVKYAMNAGYDPYALNQYLCRLKKNQNSDAYCLVEDVIKSATQKNKNQTILDKTHPPIAERLVNINRDLEKLGAKEAVGAQGRKRFAKFKSKIQKI